MTVQILLGDVRERLLELPDESVHCVVTSPPYWGLRDYGHEGQIGLEESPFEFLEVMVALFREVRRVLRSDGTAWVNMGDSYCSTDKWGGGGPNTGKQTVAEDGAVPSWEATRKRKSPIDGIKPKDLMGMPWRLAFALQADGWWLRQDIVWHKPNPMPESIADRCTKAHEYLFLITKSARYYYDAEAIKEPASDNTHARRRIVPAGWATGDGPHTAAAHQTAKNHRKIAAAGSGIKANDSMVPAIQDLTSDRNKRSVWTVPSAPFAEAHFATFPPDLIEPCILAGCPVGGTVLDPFGGAGTTGLVADRHQRNAILIELNPEYAAMAERRIRGDAPMFTEVRVA